ncbi:hypothetical protein [Rhodococcus sp. NPDC049939]|uniref:hypothetical protein n=1 Tax=Rhodococcus sp. NPDC049939 TaxID=3155511 RepID=UPI0033C5E2AA
MLLALLAYTALPASASPQWGPVAAEPNEYLGPAGTSTMHGDAESSDTTPILGPGEGPLGVSAYPLLAACPTLLQGYDELVVALCTSVVGRTPTVHLIDPKAPAGFGASLAQLKLEKGSLLGGVYAYLDNEDRLVVVDGSRHLLRVGHSKNADDKWQLKVDKKIDLSHVIASDDNVTGLAPDWDGNVWFATGGGLVGVVDDAGETRTRQLADGERIENSISTSTLGTSVATTHALYQFSLNEDGAIEEEWRNLYDRGSARNPGQLSWGTGSTPTYFGPENGNEFVAIVDNAEGRNNLLVYKTDGGEEICKTPVLGTPGGSENSPIGIGNSVFVAGTYGYPYPAVPDGAGPAVPESAPFKGGLARIDIVDGACEEVWTKDIRSSAVPQLSTGDGLLYTVIREGSDDTSILDGFSFAVIDPEDGKLLNTTELPGTMANDTLQMAGLITPGGNFWQGTVTGILRLRADGQDGGSLGSASSGIGSLGSVSSGS